MSRDEIDFETLERGPRFRRAVRKYGRTRVAKALKCLFWWTSGSTEHRITESDLEPLSVFRPSPLPERLFKGVPARSVERRTGKDDWWDLTDAQRESYVRRSVLGRPTSWTEKVTTAARFSNANVILEVRPSSSEYLFSVDMVPAAFRFSGEIPGPKILLGGGIYVPAREHEHVLVLSKSRVLSYFGSKRTKVIQHQVVWRYGQYLGDYSVDTLGLLKRAVSWHECPV